MAFFRPFEVRHDSMLTPEHQYKIYKREKRNSIIGIVIFIIAVIWGLYSGFPTEPSRCGMYPC